MDRCAVLATAAVAGTVALLGLIALASDWHPVSDWALIENLVRDVGGPHTPLTGAYSRFGWRHPGPWPFWTLAVPYRLVGARPEGLLLGAALLNAAAVVGAARVAFRRGGTALTLLVLAGLALLITALGPSLLADPWNPWLTVVPGCWLLLLAWDVACGHRWSLPLLLGAGSFLVQLHVGVAVLVAAVTAFALAALAWARDEDQDGPSWRRVAIVSGAVLLLAWGPVVVEQVTTEDGNLGQLAEFFVGGGADEARDFFGNPADPVGPADSARILAREVGVWSPWDGEREPLDLLGEVQGRHPLTLLLPAALVLVSAGIGRRLGRRALVVGAALAATALVASWLAIAAILGPAADYLVRWVYPVAFFVHLLAAWSALLVVRRRGALPPAGAWVGVGALAVWSVAMVVTTSLTLDPPREEFAGAVDGLVDPAVDWAEQHGGGPVVVTSDGGLSHVLPALVDALDRAGEDPLVTGPLAVTFPAHQRHDGGPGALHLVVAGPEARARLLEDPTAEVVAEHPAEPGDDRQPPLAVIAVPP